MDNEHQARLKHFTALKSKYQATKYEDSSPSSLLYLILRKADLGIEITDVEFDWLREHQLSETIEILQQKQQLRIEEHKKLSAEFAQLKAKYKVNHYWISDISSLLYVILCKLESASGLNNSDVSWLRDRGLPQLAEMADKLRQDIELFAALKVKYRADKHQNTSPSSHLYQILKRLEKEQQLSDSGVNWLKKNSLLETLEIYQQIAAAREAEFSQLKEKYGANKHPDSSTSSPLYSILRNVDADRQLDKSQLEWLEKNGLSETLALVREIEQKRHFAELKAKYKSTQYEDASPSSHLYKVLQLIDSGNLLGEQDINFLKKRKLDETIAIAQEQYASSLKSKVNAGEQLSESEIEWLKNNGREDIITLAQQKRFAALKRKYDASDYKDNSPTSLLYEILLKLEKRERIEPKEVVWLRENRLLYPDHKIFIAYHTIEATFGEQEYKRTGNKWNLVNASSHWRKADKPQRALEVTEKLDIDKIKEDKLKSAIMTTRGGAFRDLAQLKDAENCARKAIEYQPNSHHPYTLMGAIYYDRRQYSEGDRWFNEAIKRGAKTEDIDAEIKKVVRDTKDKNQRQEVAEYLLKKDPVRYDWVRAYLKKPKN
ncbi:MAG TPA: hypothetical protein DDW76_09030 [Cyanobacteria bacterium UBA11369]|nr:hypothetical protein [Cyanobacteria bacterium UBA11371]HBE36000.1 hypothetical protein [Cyanobacteria bacterium UBA11368]HBE48923.1 hypothetical protein [Cyanobacteria bacterium UBA11369]